MVQEILSDSFGDISFPNTQKNLKRKLDNENDTTETTTFTIFEGHTTIIRYDDHCTLINKDVKDK